MVSPGSGCTKSMTVDVPVDDLHDINPGYKRWATDPNGPHHLLVPVDKKEALIEGLNNLPESDRVQWRHHKVRRGDTLSQISRHYGIAVKVLKTANNLHSSMLHIGQDLLIPISARPLSPAVVRFLCLCAGGRQALCDGGRRC